MIRIQQQPEGFSLYFKDRKLISHSLRKPALADAYVRLVASGALGDPRLILIPAS